MFFNFFKTANAYIKGGKDFPNINGIVSFKRTKNGIILIAKINGLPQSINKCNRQVLWTSST